MKTPEEFYAEREHTFAECFDYQENLSLGLALMEDYADYVLSQSKPKWVSVNERLPDRDINGRSDDLLVCGKTYVYGDEMPFDFPTIGWITNEVWGNIMPEKMRVEVSHWMPLPNKPEQ